MPRKEGQKTKLVRLYQILAEKTDPDHLLPVSELIKELEKYGIQAERKSVYDDLNALRDELDVDVEQHKGRGGGYCLGSRIFQVAELKLLIDAVQASRFITQKKSKELIDKLGKFASRRQAAILERQVFASARIKSMNESIYYTVDTLHNAIAQNRQVQFVYKDWNLQKKKQPRRETARIVSPWALLFEEENYYLVAYEEDKGLRHYRVDKMCDLQAVNMVRQGADYYDPQKMADYAKPMFGMFGGEPQEVCLRCENAMIGPMLDRFGTGVTVICQEDEHFLIYPQVTVSPPFFGWVCGFAGKVTIQGPADVKEQFHQSLENILHKSREQE